ncbi:nucleotidyltransferase domain-containing protein [Kutzneria sp. NPDC051319]|uniref:nucleotidyltransferase domain-containing protein n=1 Tax=Kutzneria sp. NPDC051319 TaxID=3155047 RepID=UPI00342C59F2
MTAVDVPGLREVVAEQPYRLLFATVSGAHLYGFPSADSDVDLRGVHLLPADEVVGLRHGPETLERMWIRDGVELDLVTHDLLKFTRLLLRPNGYVLEQLLSPLVVQTSDAHAELAGFAAGCVTPRHAHHYRGFARTQWQLFGRSGELKPLLYTFRALLTGIHLMRTGAIEADLSVLVSELHGPSFLPELITAKAAGEHLTLTGGPSQELLWQTYEHWLAELVTAQERSTLPDHPSAEADLHKFVVQLRLDA